MTAPRDLPPSATLAALMGAFAELRLAIEDGSCRPTPMELFACADTIDQLATPQTHLDLDNADALARYFRARAIDTLLTLHSS